MQRLTLAALLVVLAACGPATPEASSQDTIPSSHHLFAWTAAADSTHPDFLAVLAVDERFREDGATEPGIRLAGVPHGAVLSRK